MPLAPSRAEPAAHERIPGAAEAERLRTFWRDRVAALKETIES